MSNLLFGHDQTVADWVAQQASVPPFHAPYDAIGILDAQGTLVGGFVFNGFNGHSIEMSLAGRGVASRGAMAAVLSYVFDQLKCSRMQMHTRRRHKRVCRQLVKLGMKYEGIARRFYGRDDAACYALTVDDLEAFKTRWRLI